MAVPEKVWASSGVPPWTSILGSTGSCIPHHLSGLLPYSGPPMRIRAWAISPPRGFGDKATLCRPRGSPCSWPVCRNNFSSGHWPASGASGHNCGSCVEGPLNLPHDRLWVIPCRRVSLYSRSQGSWSSLPNTRLAGFKPVVLWVGIM
jgi:hypothetical protein